MRNDIIERIWLLIQSQGELLLRYVATAVGGVIALLNPTVPFILVSTIAVLLDCYTAWELSKRVHKQHPEKNDGKFKSSYAGKVFKTLIEVYVAVIFAYLVDSIIFPGWGLYLPNVVAGAVCFWQAWSMLENKSSCNDAKWARVLQRVMVDKTERHFNIDLSMLKDENNNQNSNSL